MHVEERRLEIFDTRTFVPSVIGLYWTWTTRNQKFVFTNGRVHATMFKNIFGTFVANEQFFDIENVPTFLTLKTTGNRRPDSSRRCFSVLIFMF